MSQCCGQQQISSFIQVKKKKLGSCKKCMILSAFGFISSIGLLWFILSLSYIPLIIVFCVSVSAFAFTVILLLHLFYFLKSNDQSK